MVIRNLNQLQSDMIDAFQMEFSKDDIKKYPQVKKLAKCINKYYRKINKINKLLYKIS
jgi:hypothetical protein